MMNGFFKCCCSIVVSSIVLLSCKKDTTGFVPLVIPINEVVDTAPHLLTPVSFSINEVTHGLYSAVPASYSKTTKNYPLLIFVPGAGQLGRTAEELKYLLQDGVGKLLQEKKFPPNFAVNNKNFSFIILIPQFSQVPTNQQVLSFLEYAKQNYRADLSRIYFSGLSMGGIVATDMGAAYGNQIAAIAPMAGVCFEGVVAKSEKIASWNLPVWVFHNDNDPQFSVQIPLYFISEVKRFNPAVTPRLTVFNAYGHDAWADALNPLFKEEGKNVYEWMLQYTR